MGTLFLFVLKLLNSNLKARKVLPGLFLRLIPLYSSLNELLGFQSCRDPQLLQLSNLEDSITREEVSNNWTSTMCFSNALIKQIVYYNMKLQLQVQVQVIKKQKQFQLALKMSVASELVEEIKLCPGFGIGVKVWRVGFRTLRKNRSGLNFLWQDLIQDKSSRRAKQGNNKGSLNSSYFLHLTENRTKPDRKSIFFLLEDILRKLGTTVSEI